MSTQNPRFSLAKQQRLRTPQDFQRVYQAKQWGHSAHHSYNVSYNVAIHKAKPALGVTVSKKVSKLAVERNKFKRQIKEFYRLNQHQLALPAELVITAKPSCATVSSEQRQQSLEQLWQKLLKWQRWQQKQQTKTLTD